MNSKIGQTGKVLVKSPIKLEVAGEKKMVNEKKIYSTMFEIFGRVQGVYFRKHTQMKAKELGLKGWCMNTEDGTVKGLLEGPQDIISEMKLWLHHKGSPRSVIEKAVFTSNEPISQYNFTKFTIRR